LGRRFKRSFGAPDPLPDPSDDESVVVVEAAAAGSNGETATKVKSPRKAEVFVVSAPVAPEATDVSEDDESDGSTPSEDQAARRTGTASTRRKRRPDVTRNPRTRGRSTPGDSGSTKSDHASDSPRETS
jgi:hypothetical protein